MLRLVLLFKVVLITFTFEPITGRQNKTIKKITFRINTTACCWKERGKRCVDGTVSMKTFQDSSYNHGPYKYGVCTIIFKEPLVINKSSPVNIFGRHSLAIESNESIIISSPLNLDWSPARNRSDMWLGGFCSRDDSVGKTYGNGPGGGPCHGGAGHGGMGRRFERDQNDVKYGWRYAADNPDVALIGGSSGGHISGRGFSCGGGALMISSNKSITIDSSISTNAYNLMDGSCVNGGSGGTIIVRAKDVILTANASLVSRGGSVDSLCKAEYGSGGVIVINGTINGTVPNPLLHTSPVKPGNSYVINGVVLINGKSENRLQPLAEYTNGDLGCYSSTKVFNYSILPDYGVTPVDCKRDCKECGYRYAVLHVKLCVCVDFLDGMKQVNKRMCSLRCFANENIACGGQNGSTMFYAIYDLKWIIRANDSWSANKSSNISTPETCPQKIFHFCNYPNTTSTKNKLILTVAPMWARRTSTYGTTPSSAQSNKTKQLLDLSQVNVTKNNSGRILKRLSNITTSKGLSAAELNISLSIFEKIVQKNAIHTKTKAESKRVGQFVLNIAENLLNSSDSTWSVFKKEKKKTPESLLNNVEQAVAELGKNFGTNDSLSLNSSSFALRIEHVDPTQVHNRTFTFFGLDIQDSGTNMDYEDNINEVMFLPSSLNEAIQGSGPFNLHLLKYLPHSVLVNASLKNSSTRGALASNVIAISVSPPLKKNLNNDVVLSFPFSKTSTNDVEKSCQFLDFSEESDVSWSTRGCVLDSNNNGKILCRCNHFTNFAVLTNVHQVPMEETHLVALHWLTYVGCAVSLICLVVTLTTFAVLKSLICDHIWIHCNLIASLIMAQLVFVFGIKATENKGLCQAIAMALQYLYTAAIFWMGIEGVHLYRKVVKVFMKSSVKKFYYIFGWGGPAVVVLISASLKFDGFGSDKACWLSTEKGLIWAFLAPVLSVVLGNLIILVLVIRIMLVAVKSTMPQNGQNSKSSIRKGIRGVVFLLPILGLTWSFGILAVNSAAVVFQYVFTVLNSFQGFFIFLFHCVFNKDVRAARKKRQRKKTNERWSNESSWKSKEHHCQKSSVQTSQVSFPFVTKIDVKASPVAPRNNAIFPK